MLEVNGRLLGTYVGDEQAVRAEQIGLEPSRVGDELRYGSLHDRERPISIARSFSADSALAAANMVSASWEASSRSMPATILFAPTRRLPKVNILETRDLHPLAASFSGVAGAYERGRPEYAPWWSMRSSPSCT